jgi:O-glycosyl hydrolase
MLTVQRGTLMTNRSRNLIAAAAIAAIAAATLAAPTAPASAASAVHVWLTTPDLTSRLTQQPDVALSVPGSATLTMNSAQRYQTIDGFGAAFTDSSTWLIGTKLNATARTQVMQDLFTTSASGIGLSMSRAPMGASDFSVNGVYSYADASQARLPPNLLDCPR